MHFQPTNHLDITSKEVLEEALLNYAGSVVLISHDRYFLSQVANTIFSFHDHSVERFDCDYHDYLEREASALEELQAAQNQQEQDQRDAADALAAGLAGTEARPTLFEDVNERTSADIVTDTVERLLPPLPNLPIDLSEIAIVRSSKDAKISVTVANSRQDARGKVSLKEKVTARYVAGDKYKITNAKEVLVEIGEDDRKNKKKNFGGSGVTCGNLHKGIKNAKRFKSNI